MPTSPLLQLLHIALGKADRLQAPLSDEEWMDLLKVADDQAMSAFLFSGIERLPEEQKPSRRPLMHWYNNVQQTEEDNHLVDKVAAWATRSFLNDNIRVCLLKGQGNARQYYPVPSRRQPGDVDLWIDMPIRDAIAYVHRYCPGTKATYIHVDFPVRKDVEIEVHYRPAFLCSPIRNRRLQRFFKKQKAAQFEKKIRLGESERSDVVVPNTEFNALFLLCHMYKHVFEEGLGLRQLLDYYYLLLHTDADLRELTYQRACSLGMKRFAGDVMYILKTVFLLPDTYLLTAPNEKSGKFLLQEVMLAGNFGQGDLRYDFQHETQAQKFVRKLLRNLRFVRNYPEEVLCEPFYRIYHWCWRKYFGRF